MRSSTVQELLVRGMFRHPGLLLLFSTIRFTSQSVSERPSGVCPSGSLCQDVPFLLLISGCQFQAPPIELAIVRDMGHHRHGQLDFASKRYSLEIPPVPTTKGPTMTLEMKEYVELYNSGPVIVTSMVLSSWYLTLTR